MPLRLLSPRAEGESARLAVQTVVRLRRVPGNRALKLHGRVVHEQAFAGAGAIGGEAPVLAPPVPPEG